METTTATIATVITAIVTMPIEGTDITVELHYLVLRMDGMTAKGNFYPAAGNGFYDKHGNWHYFHGRESAMEDDR